MPVRGAGPGEAAVGSPPASRESRVRGRGWGAQAGGPLPVYPLCGCVVWCVCYVCGVCVVCVQYVVRLVCVVCCAVYVVCV